MHQTLYLTEQFWKIPLWIMLDLLYDDACVIFSSGFDFLQNSNYNIGTYMTWSVINADRGLGHLLLSPIISNCFLDSLMFMRFVFAINKRIKINIGTYMYDIQHHMYKIKHSRIGQRIMEISGEKRSTSYLMQVIGMAIQRGNSACILETVSDSRKLDEVYYL